MSDERNNKDSLRTALQLLPDCAAPRPAVLRCAVLCVARCCCCCCAAGASLCTRCCHMC